MQYDRKKMVYTPEIKVYHLEDASTNACIKKARKKMIFIRTEYIKSLTALMEIYEKCDKSKNDRKYNMKISIIVPVYNTKKEYQKNAWIVC